MYCLISGGLWAWRLVSLAYFMQISMKRTDESQSHDYRPCRNNVLAPSLENRPRVAIYTGGDKFKEIHVK